VRACIVASQPAGSAAAVAVTAACASAAAAAGAGAGAGAAGAASAGALGAAAAAAAADAATAGGTPPVSAAAVPVCSRRRSAAFSTSSWLTRFCGERGAEQTQRAEAARHALGPCGTRARMRATHMHPAQTGPCVCACVRGCVP
jgi:hypothetical protein